MESLFSKIYISFYFLINPVSPCEKQLPKTNTRTKNHPSVQHFHFRHSLSSSPPLLFYARRDREREKERNIKRNPRSRVSTFLGFLFHFISVQLLFLLHCDLQQFQRIIIVDCCQHWQIGTCVVRRYFQILCEELKADLVSMVCTLGRGKMTAMVRLLANGHFPDITAEEAHHEKLAVQSIRSKLLDADEANMLEEEDMHVFDCKPMTDPLHLVSCNGCRKPVKASQYAAHAERCRSLHSKAETFLELDGGTGHKKPPKKGRKKIQAAHGKQAITIGEQDRSGSIDGDVTPASESNVDDLTRMTSSCSREAKRNSTSIGGASVMDGSQVGPGSTDYKASVISSAEKRTKLIVAEHLLIPEGLETTCGVTKNVGINCQGALTYPPAPLATKMYNLQRSHRLRSALSHQYHESLTKDDCCDVLDTNLVQGNALQPTEVSSPRSLVLESHGDDMLQKVIVQKDAYTLPAVQKPDQILAQSSELCLGNTGGYQPAMNFSNQFRDNNFSRSVLSVDTAPMGMMRNRYLTTTYSFPGNSGTSLGTLQQPNGSVPVI